VSSLIAAGLLAYWIIGLVEYSITDHRITDYGELLITDYWPLITIFLRDVSPDQSSNSDDNLIQL